MGVFEVIVVFTISWWVVFLPTLSAGTRSQYEAGVVSAGSEPAAPEKVNWRPKLFIATGGASAITALVWTALYFGWLKFMIPSD